MPGRGAPTAAAAPPPAPAPGPDLNATPARSDTAAGSMMGWFRDGYRTTGWDAQSLRSSLTQAANQAAESARMLAEQADAAARVTLSQAEAKLKEADAVARNTLTQADVAARNTLSEAQAKLAASASEVQNLAEQSGAALRFDQADLQQYGQHLRVSAQTLAEQSSAAFRASADKVVGAVSEQIDMLPRSGVLSSGSEEPMDLGTLTRSFASEASALESSSRGAELRTLKIWETRLIGKAASEATTALKALLQSQALYILLRVLSRSAPGRSVLRAAADPGPGLGGAPLKALPEAGRLLLAILSLASAASPALLRQLLPLLADVAEESDRGNPGSNGLPGPHADDIQWVLQLISATLMQPSEVAAREAYSLQEAVATALEDSGPSKEASATLQKAVSVTADASTGESEDDKVVDEPLSVGAEVWAAYAGDGRWYRAQVKDVSDHEVEVVWLRPPAGEGGTGDDQYLSTSGSDDTMFTKLSAAAVSGAAKPRPNQDSATSVRTDPIFDGCWQTKLAALEATGRNFRRLRELSNALAKGGSRTASNNDEAVDASFSATSTILQTLRTEGENRATKLANAAADCVNSGRGTEEQLSTSHEGFETELKTVHQQQDGLRSNIEQLYQSRQELVAKLQALDDSIRTVEADMAKAKQREQQIREAEARVAKELKRELTTEEQTGKSFATWQRLLTEAGAASHDVEQLLDERAQAMKRALAARQQLADKREAISAASLDSERERRRLLTDLLATWHAAIWGPGAKELAQDAVQLAAIRNLHQRAASVVELYWREAVQIAAEDLEEGFSRAAETYKDMRRQIEENMERLSKLEELVANRIIGQDTAAAPPALEAAPASNVEASSPAATVPKGPSWSGGREPQQPAASGEPQLPAASDPIAAAPKEDAEDDAE